MTMDKQLLLRIKISTFTSKNYCNSFYQGILDALQFNLFSLLSPTSVQLILYGDRHSFDLKNLKKFSEFVYFSPQATIEFGGSDEENCLVSILEEQGLGQYQMELLNVVHWFWEVCISNWI